MISLRTITIAFRASPRAVLAALWAWVRGKRVRARNRLYSAAHESSEYYPLWISLVEAGKIDAYCSASKSLEELPPIIALVFGNADASAKDAERTIASLRSAFPTITAIHCSVDGVNGRTMPKAGLGDWLNSQIGAHPDAWLLPMMTGDEIAANAQRAIACAMAYAPDGAIIYWDEDRLDGRKRRDPWLKPDWDELLFLACDLLTGAGLFRASAMAANGSSAEPVSSQAIARAVISMASRPDGRSTPIHVPLILSHRKADSAFIAPEDRRTAIEAMWPEPIEVAAIAGLPDASRPRFLTELNLPKVSVLIPTRNRHELLGMCMHGLSKVEYAGGIETIVIDNDSDEPETIEYLDQLRRSGTIVIDHPGPFNFSAMNNRAARIATGELLCLLNNDIEMRDGAWLDSMARHAMRPGVGAVGALLQYPDGTVQHAGVSIGTGNAAGHVYRGVPIADTGHRDMHRLTRSVSAVTAACMVVRREIFMEVGGLDEQAFRVAFNDVDFCLKLRAKGYRNIFAAEAHLTHHESKSRGCDFSDANRARYLGELERLQVKWETKTFVDPYHHPLAMRSSEKFVLSP